jgi:hypothetical protein
MMHKLTLRAKLSTFVSAACVLILIPACAVHNQQAIVQPVGPAPQTRADAETAGYLVVYSAWSNFVDQGSTGHHSRYTISSEDGKLLREVINHVDRFDEGPIQLPLAPGSYQIRARSAHYGRVTIPIIIQPRQTTFVYLDGSSHRNFPSDGENKAVKLPNGEIVGWSATVAGNGGH